MPRMNILNTVEREAFNSPPVFSSFQRKQYFDFPSKLRRFAAGLRNPTYQLGFLLSAGYFKAARRFFSPGSFHPRDIDYVARQLEPGARRTDTIYLTDVAAVIEEVQLQCFKANPRNLTRSRSSDRL
jgi:uncharacterized protein DUF4158